MRFEEALIELRKGKKIFRHSKNYHYSLECLHEDCDMLAEDWEIIEETGKTFPEVFQAFKEGKFIKRKSWSYDSYVRYKSICNKTMAFKFSPNDILATDWEIVE